MSQQEDKEKEKNGIANKLEELGNRIKNNNRVISGVGLNTKDKHWIYDLLTIENAIILGGCYMLYKLVLSDKGK